MTENNKEHPWNETIRTIVFALVLAFLFQSVAFQPFNIPSGSMKNNLLVGDYLFVSKYSYGYSRYSFSNRIFFPVGLPLFKARILETEPKRGDVVVFRFPPNPKVDYIKRLIGLPGDSVQVKDGVLYINGTALKRQPLDDVPYSDDGLLTDVRSMPSFKETLPEGKVITILKEKTRSVPKSEEAWLEQSQMQRANNTPVFVVPEGHYFMMGDNRDHSNDSRLDVGFVPKENLIGRAEIIFFSTDGSAEWYNPISWVTALRSDRFFKRIE